MLNELSQKIFQANKEKEIEELKIQLQNNYGNYHNEIKNLQKSLDDIKNISIFEFLKLKRK
jgi:hypothetical protein